MKIKKMHIVGITIGIIILLIDVIFFLDAENKNLFLFFLGIVFAVLALPFVVGVVLENKKEQEISDMFLEFSRNLAESVAVGTPVSKSVMNMKSKNYGLLNPNIEKLANQISIGIPVSQALQTFALDVNNPVITRATTLISEAEKAGGEIDYILESSAKSIAEIEKLKKERMAAVSSIVVQGYIIFFIFIGIMLVIEFKILPLTAGIGDFGGVGLNFNNPSQLIENNQTSTETYTNDELSNPLFYLLVTQGLFAGLVIGKVTEGNVKSGIKHSFILAIAAFLISTGSRIMFSPSIVAG
ncbi:MAG: type II secretion system F family protein [Nanoarchaeota archaeon]